MSASRVIWLVTHHALLAGALVLAAAFTMRLGMVIVQRQAAAGALAGAEGGTAVLDFVLTLPFFAMSVMIVVQTALLVNARLVVGYAAFAAARSAVVWVPAGDLDVAREHATDAAALACLPISPGVGGPIATLSGAEVALAFIGGSDPLRRIARAGAKYQYALAATSVELSGIEDPAQAAPITATVSYRFYLSVPYAGAIFAALLGGTMPAPPGFTGGGSLSYADLGESFTLVNQGKLHAGS
jgi:hypothetical protein